MKCMNFVCVCQYIFCMVACSSNYDNHGQEARSAMNTNERIGHLKPIGKQRATEGNIDTFDGFPKAKEFFKEYVQNSRPVILKQAAKNIPAFNLWTDEYLMETFGTLPVDVEVGKKENRSEGSLEMTLKQFIQVYKTEDIYVIQNLVQPLQADLSLPPCLQCGGFERGLEVGVLWFSSGDTKSVLHHDELDNINCLLDGHKTFILFDREYDYLLESEFWEYEGTYSNVDVDAVDLDLFPSLSQAPWWSAEIEAGDCLFIPYKWYHTVHSHPGRNLAVNLFFSHRLWLDEDHCDSMSNPAHLAKLSDYTINSLHPEAPSVEKIRCMIFEVFEKEPEIDLELATDIWEEILPPEAVQELFEIVDLDKDMILSWSEVYTADVLALIMDFPELLPEDVDNVYDEWENEEDHDEL